MEKLGDMDISWTWLHFDQLSARQLDQIYQLRQSVFVVEQNCPYQDADGKDHYAYHLMGFAKDKLVATVRLFSEYAEYDNQVAIGRVCTAQEVRNFGVGRKLMNEAIRYAELNYPNRSIQIGAQAYLEKFYGSLGFKTVSDIYLEDDIPHYLMQRK